MKYMFVLFNEEVAQTPTPEVMAPWMAFGEAAAKVATQVSAEALQPGETASVVSVRNGETIITDGPFIDTKEQLGGYYVFDCENLDVALELAAKIPWAHTGHIEVRPVMELS